eukprot:1382402-Alexandrium_andersonii.AAC.1
MHTITPSPTPAAAPAAFAPAPAPAPPPVPTPSRPLKLWVSNCSGWRWAMLGARHPAAWAELLRIEAYGHRGDRNILE